MESKSNPEVVGELLVLGRYRRDGEVRGDAVPGHPLVVQRAVAHDPLPEHEGGGRRRNPAPGQHEQNRQGDPAEDGNQGQTGEAGRHGPASRAHAGPDTGFGFPDGVPFAGEVAARPVEERAEHQLDRVVAVVPGGHPVFDGADLGLVGAEEAVPENEDPGVVPVNAPVVRSVVDPGGGSGC